MSAEYHGVARPTEKHPIPRMRHNPELGDENTLRERLIMARVMNGFTAVQAAELLGYQNSTQLSLIESGHRKVPNDRIFILKMSRVYSVSVDFLLGVSPNSERDAILSEQFALMRGIEDLIKQQAATITTAFVKYAAQGKPSMPDFQKICEEVDAMAKAIATLRERNESFDDLRGGSTVLAVVDRLSKAVHPIRGALGRRKELEAYMMALASGKEGPLSYLLDGQPCLDLEGNQIPPSCGSRKSQ